MVKLKNFRLITALPVGISAHPFFLVFLPVGMTDVHRKGL